MRLVLRESASSDYNIMCWCVDNVGTPFYSTIPTETLYATFFTNTNASTDF